MIKQWLIYILFCVPSLSVAQTEAPPTTNVLIEGRLLERGTKKPLADTNIFILPHKLKATTDAKGRFRFEQVPVGKMQWVVNSPNYQRLELDDEIQAHAVNELISLYLEKQSYQAFETTIVGKAKKEDQTVRTLKASQVATMPGANGDPVKAVQNLPGVNRAAGFSSQVIIQGSSPQDTRYLLDEHEVPIIFHFGGLTSVLTPEAVERVDYFSAGYGSEYGRAMGGQVGLITRTPKNDRWQGHAFMDTSKAGGLYEGPVGEKGSLLLSGRYSYIGEVIKTLFKDNDQLNLTVAPQFSDFTGIYATKPTEKDEVKVVGIASRDKLAFVLNEPLRTDPAIRGNFTSETNFYRLIPQWNHKIDENRATHLSIGAGKDQFNIDIGDQYFKLNSTAVSVRGHYKHKIKENWESKIGIDNRYYSSVLNIRLPAFSSSGGVNNPVSSNDTQEANITSKLNYIGTYWKNDIKLSETPWTLSPALRADYFAPTKEFLPAPRIAARYELTDTWNFYSSLGLYYQPPQPQETDSTFGNPAVRSPRAWHGMIGTEKDFRSGSRGFIASTNLFYKKFENLVVSSSDYTVRDGVLVAEKYNNKGEGRAYGAEMLLRLESDPWMGWLSYTLSRSFRTNPGQSEYPFQYDQTHNINLLVSYDFPRNWKLSSRARYVTGNPTTPVVGGIYDSDNDVYIPVRGPYFSERLEPFFQLDLRADKKWVYDTWILWAYLDIQNISSQKNAESIRYSYDYSSKATITGLPIFPTLGVKGEF
ncbi:MAG: TonB-dependent receptor plug domain-containing protein [Bdellovibrionales bacterium]